MALPNTPQNDAWFFRVDAPLNVRGARINLADKGEPDQDLMEKLVSSFPNLTEGRSAAKTTTGGARQSEVGLVSIMVDPGVSPTIDRTSGLLANDRTIVPHRGQLPSVDQGAAQTFTSTVAGPWNNPILSFIRDITVTTRDVFLGSFEGSFVTWLQSIFTQVDTNVSDIATNASNISTNTSNIGANTTEVGYLRTLSGTTTPATDLGTFTHGLITANTNIKTALQDLEDEVNSIVPGTGVIDSGLNVGTGAGAVFRGIDPLTPTRMDFKTLKDSTYTTITDNADDITIAIDEPVLTGYYNTLYARTLSDIKTVGEATIIATGGNNYDFRGITGGTGINASVATGDIVLAVDTAYIQSLIDASMATTGVSYLFYATGTADQVFYSTGEKIQFLDDYTQPSFDNGDTWSVSQWTANASAVSEDIEWDAKIAIKNTTGSPFGTGATIYEVDVNLVEEIAGVRNILQVLTFDVQGLGIGASTLPQLITNEAMATVGAAGDNVYLEIGTMQSSATTLAAAGSLAIDSDRYIFNVPA
jgi:hypothetical protein